MSLETIFLFNFFRNSNVVDNFELLPMGRVQLLQVEFEAFIALEDAWIIKEVELFPLWIVDEFSRDCKERSICMKTFVAYELRGWKMKF